MAIPATPVLAGGRSSPRQVASAPFLNEARSPSRLAAGARTALRASCGGLQQRAEASAAPQVAAKEASVPALAAKASPPPRQRVALPLRSRSLSSEPPSCRSSLGSVRHEATPSQLGARQPQDRRKPYYAKAKDLRTHLEREAEHLRRREETRKKKEAERLLQEEEERERELRECTFRPQLVTNSPRARTRTASPGMAQVEGNNLAGKLRQLKDRQLAATAALQALAVDEARLWKRLCVVHAEICDRIQREAVAELSNGFSIGDVGLTMEEVQQRAQQAFQPTQAQAEGELYGRRLSLVQELEAIEAQALIVLHNGLLMDKARAIGLEFGLAEHARRSLPQAGANQHLITPTAPAPAAAVQHSSSSRRLADGSASASAMLPSDAPPAPGPARVRRPGEEAATAAPSPCLSSRGSPGMEPRTPRSSKLRGQVSEESPDFLPVCRRLEFPTE